MLILENVKLEKVKLFGHVMGKGDLKMTVTEETPDIASSMLLEGLRGSVDYLIKNHNEDCKSCPVFYFAQQCQRHLKDLDEEMKTYLVTHPHAGHAQSEQSS